MVELGHWPAGNALIWRRANSRAGASMGRRREQAAACEPRRHCLGTQAVDTAREGRLTCAGVLPPPRAAMTDDWPLRGREKGRHHHRGRGQRHHTIALAAYLSTRGVGRDCGVARTNRLTRRIRIKNYLVYYYYIIIDIVWSVVQKNQ